MSGRLSFGCRRKFKLSLHFVRAFRFLVNCPRRCCLIDCRKSFGRRNQLMFLLVFTVVAMFIYYSTARDVAFRKTTVRRVGLQESIRSTGYLVKTPGCRIPALDPFDKAILKYISPFGGLKCDRKPPLIHSNQTSIWVDKSALPKYDVSDIDELKCCYSNFSRPIPDEKALNIDIDSTIRMSKECIEFKESVHIYNEFVQVKCRLGGEVIYKDYHAFIVPKEKKLSLAAKNQPDGPSVLIIGADALSRNNLYRQMPKTLELLHSLKAYEFFGYNKVEDHTFTNLIPVLAGHYVYEIHGKCWPHSTAFFDNCSWVWDLYAMNNYYTAMAEDASRLGIFNFYRRGFMNPPTDYYLRPYMYVNDFWIGHTAADNLNFCSGSRLTAEVFLDYAHKFAVNMTESSKKYWGFFWEVTLTHDYLNIPPESDQVYYDFFKSLQKNNVLNDTVVMFMSDHGMRVGAIRETYQGRMEENLPYLYILMPDWVKAKYKEAAKNMEDNTHLLTTHFDLHETLVDLSDLNTLRPESLRRRTSVTRGDRGISLFLPIPTNRTCSSAGIDPPWCTCQSAKEISVTDKYAVKSVKTAIKHLNTLMTNYPQCAKLRLKRIIGAHVESQEELMKEKRRHSKITDYVVTFQTVPGLGKFEATVRLRGDTKQLSVTGKISRINLYGSQSKCVTDFRLKLYCYCKNYN